MDVVYETEMAGERIELIVIDIVCVYSAFGENDKLSLFQCAAHYQRQRSLRLGVRKRGRS